MNTQNLITAVCAMHTPAAIENAMVYEVWEDGEVTLTKGGDLYGQRTLHIDAYGDASYALPPNALPMKNTRHSRIVAKDRADAYKARALILGEATSN